MSNNCKNKPNKVVIGKRKHCSTTLYRSLATLFGVIQKQIDSMPKSLRISCGEKIASALFDLTVQYRETYEEINQTVKLEKLQQCIISARKIETYILFLYDSFLAENKFCTNCISLLGDIFSQMMFWQNTIKNKIELSDGSKDLQGKC